MPLIIDLRQLENNTPRQARVVEIGVRCPKIYKISKDTHTKKKNYLRLFYEVACSLCNFRLSTRRGVSQLSPTKFEQMEIYYPGWYYRWVELTLDDKPEKEPPWGSTFPPSKYAWKLSGTSLIIGCHSFSMDMRDFEPHSTDLGRISIPNLLTLTFRRLLSTLSWPPLNC